MVRSVVLVLASFSTGFVVAWLAKPAPSTPAPAPTVTAPADDYKPIAEVLAAENVALEAEAKIRDELIQTMRERTELLETLVEKEPLEL